MRTNEIIGFRAFHHDSNGYLHHDPTTGQNFLSSSEPAPISRADCHRRIAAYVEQPGHENDDDFSIDPVYRETSPLEDAAAELGGLLVGLCQRHRLDLGLTRDQVNKMIAKELEAIKGGASPTLGFLAGGIPSNR